LDSSSWRFSRCFLLSTRLIIPLIIRIARGKIALAERFFDGIIKDMRGRPKKDPADKKTEEMALPLTPAEKATIIAAAELDESKHVPWARERLLAAAKKRIKKEGGKPPAG
jgi:hypothetical protein